MVFITAEIGTNHTGSLDIAKKIIDLAVNADCDAVKFQKKNVEKIYTKEFLDSYCESPWGTTQREMRLHREFSEKQFQSINRRVGYISHISISSDGKLAFVIEESNFDHSIELWNVLTGKKIETIQGHSNSVAAIKFGPRNAVVRGSSRSKPRVSGCASSRFSIFSAAG